MRERFTVQIANTWTQSLGNGNKKHAKVAMASFKREEEFSIRVIKSIDIEILMT